MKILFFLLSFLFSEISLGRESINLQEAYHSALEKTETVPVQMNLTEQSKETVSQAWGSLLPSVNYSYTYSKLGGKKNTSAIIFSTNIVSKIAVTQPLYQGGKEYAAVRIAEAELLSNQLMTDQTRITLFQDIANVYFSVLAGEKDLEDLKESLKLRLERAEQLEKWHKIGRARKGDVLLEKSSIATLKAQIDSDKNEISQNRFRFSYLTGLNETIKLQNTYKVPSKLAHLNSYLDKIERRPDIQSLRTQLHIADENISLTKGDHYPTLSAFGDVYFIRTGAQGSWYDLGLNFVFPIYHGGTVKSQVRQAILKQSQAQLQLNQTLRNTENNIRTYYDAVVSGLAQIKSYTLAAKTAEENYHEQMRDFKNGLITNLDVIAALSTLQDSRRALDQTIYQTIKQYVQLESSVGVVPN